MKHYRCRVLNWFGVALLASIGAVHGAGRENVVGRENIGPPDNAEAPENYQVVSLKRLFFASAKNDLSREEKISLGYFLEHFRWSNQVVIELRGYADGAESMADNAALSAQRAEAIARFLNASGIPSQTIRTIGLGVIEGGPANNPEHRRVDLRIFAQPTGDLSSRGQRITGLALAGR